MSVSRERIAALAQRMMLSTSRSPRFRSPTPLGGREVLLLGSWTRRFFRDARLYAGVLAFLRSGGRGSSKRAELDALMSGLVRTVQEFERGDLQDLALEVIPETVYTDVEGILASRPDASIGAEDALAISLLRWFKNEFMRWVDPIPCPMCGGSTQNVGSTEPTPEERKGGAGRVEMWACTEDRAEGGKCPGLRRFARYNDIPTLLRTREGRCGEFAHLFTHLLRAVGLTSRYIWNAEDHVFSEYWSAALGHWVHLDPSEGEDAWDTPWLYEKGWGKGMSYVFAVGREGVEDVTRVYVDDWEARRARRGRYREMDIRERFAALTATARSALPESRRQELAAQDGLQAAYKADVECRRRAAERERQVGQLKGRQSGSKEWRAVRQELGLDAGAAEPMPAVGDRLYSQSKEPGPKLSGSATWVDQSSAAARILQVTPCATSSCGSAFAPPISKSERSVVIDVTFRMTKHSPSAEGADGMAVVCLAHEAGEAPTKLLGNGGAGMGYEGLGDPGDWAVEIDTYQSRDSCNDPPVPHISLHSPPMPHHRNALACTKPGSVPPISDGSWRTLRLHHDGANRKVKAWLIDPVFDDVEASRGAAGDALFLWEATLPALDEDKTMTTYGVTAATGGFAQAHEIAYWEISVASEPNGLPMADVTNAT